MKLVNIHTLLLFLLLGAVGKAEAQSSVWTLQQCIDTAQVYNKSLQINRNNIGAADQRQKEAKANLIPKVTAQAEYKYYWNLPYQLMPQAAFGGPPGQFNEVQFGVPHNIAANVQLAMPIYNPQIYGGIEGSKIALELSVLQYEKTEEQVYFEVSNLYYNVQILFHQLAFIDSNLTNTERLLKTMELLHQQSLATKTDVNKVKLQAEQLSTQKQTVKSKYDQVLDALKLAMGVSSDLQMNVDTAIHYGKESEYTSLTTLEGHIAEVQSRLISSELNTLKRSRYLPTLNLFGTYGTTGFGFDEQPNSFLNFYPIGFAGIQLSYPLFNGTVTHRKISQKRLELENSKLQMGLISEQTAMQVKNARSQRSIAYESIATTQQQIELAQSIYEQTILQQKQGTVSLTEVLLADNALREAQQSYLTSVIDYLKADLDLKKLTGNISIKNNS